MLHVADHRLDGASSFEPTPFARFHALFAPVGQVNSGVAKPFRVALVVFVAVGVLGLPADQVLHLLQGPFEGVAVERVVVQGTGSDDPVVSGCCDDRN